MDVDYFGFNWDCGYKIRVFGWEKSGLKKVFEEISKIATKERETTGTIFQNVYFSFSLVSNGSALSVKQEVNKDLSHITSAPGAINKVNIIHPVKNTTITCYWTLTGLAYPPSGTVNESTYF